MSDNNLRLQVILNAVDKLTRPFRSAQASSRELAAAVKKSRDAIKQLDQAGSSLDSFRKLQAENQKLGDRLNYARQRANLLSQELGAMGPPSQRQVVALGRQRLAVQCSDLDDPEEPELLPEELELLKKLDAEEE